MNQLENSLRIKVTGECNQQCSFCHKEGGMGNIDDIFYTSELGKFIERLYNDFNIETIAITGGEPLLHNNLAELFLSIISNTSIKKFSLTTNGTIEKNLNFWITLKDLGLKNINISIHDISNDKNNSFNKQLKTIQLINKSNMIPTINIVVYKDINHLINLLSILFEMQKLNFKIALLPDLTNSKTFTQSQLVISEVLNILKCKPVDLSFRKGTSSKIYNYVTLQSRNLQVKTTKPNGNPQRLMCLCRECNFKEQCQEGFYGIRLESINKKLMVRLCLYKSNSKVLVPISQFFSSDIYSELKTLWVN